MQPLPTLALCMIVRDNAEHIEETLLSVVDRVNELVIVDTGSRDATRDVIIDFCTRRRKEFHLLDFTPERYRNAFILDLESTFAEMEERPPGPFSGQILLADYGEARQFGWQSARCDYQMWIDSDDVVAGADRIPHILSAMVERNLDTAVFEYDYAQDDDDRSTCLLYRMRIARRGFTRWHDPIHETLQPVGRSEIFKDVRIVHRARKLALLGKQSRPAHRNYKILLHQLHQLKQRGVEPHPRLLFYLGNEARLFDEEKAIAWFDKYVATTEWDEERALAHIYTGQILEGRGQLEEARGHYAAASVVCPDKPEGHFGLSRVAHYLGDHHEAVRHHRNGEIALHKARDVLHYSPTDRYYFPSIIGGGSYLAIGEPKRALRLAERGFDHSPFKEKDVHLNAIRARAQAQLSVKYRARSIAIWTGKSLEIWTPRNIHTTGIGGSETAAIHMSRELAALGHKVTVYADCKPGTYDSVTYARYDAVTEISADVFISSRQLRALDAVKISAARKIFWMHDINAGAAVPDVAGRLLKFDYILCVSKWHRNYITTLYPFLDPTRVIPTRNGIDPQLFAAEPLKIGNRLVYSSSPDRGLAYALDFFQHVRSAVPDAELHVYYGFENIEKTARLIHEGQTAKPANFEETLQEIARLKEAVTSTPGVVYHGRKDQIALAQAMLAAKALFYPTWFEETSCITAMEAQAAACVPITTSLAALSETVHHGFLFAAHPSDERYKKKFIERTIWCLTHEKERAEFATKGRIEALSLHPWSRVADEWNDFLSQIF